MHPDLEDEKSSVFPFSSSFGGIETKFQTQECERTESYRTGESRLAHSLCLLGVSNLNSTITSTPRPAASSESFL